MFPHMNYFIPVLRFAHVAENVQQCPMGSHFSVGRRILCNTRSLSLLDRILAFRIDCSSLGPPMLMLNLETLKIFVAFFNVENICWILDFWFLTLKNKAENDLFNI